MPHVRAELWSTVRTERLRLADDLETLEPADWARPTLCGTWDVEDVVAHLTAAATVTPDGGSAASSPPGSGPRSTTSAVSASSAGPRPIRRWTASAPS